MQSDYRNNRFYAQPGPILWGIAWGIVLLGILQCVCPKGSDLPGNRLVAIDHVTSSPSSSRDSSSSCDEQNTEKSHSFDHQDGLQYDYGFCPNDPGITTEFLRTFSITPSNPLKQVKREGTRCLGGLPGAEQMVHVYRSDADRALLIPALSEPLYLILRFFRN